MLSGKDGLFDKVRGRLAGAVDHVAKPFDPAVLVQAVERHCRPA
jgi:twitching motility two-component system response regulator PilG